MASLNKLVVNLSANTAKFDKSMKRSQASIKRMTSSVIRLAGAYVGLRSAKAAIDLARTQAKAEKVLAATLKATGEAAGFSFSQLTRYAARAAESYQLRRRDNNQRDGDVVDVQEYQGRHV